MTPDASPPVDNLEKLFHEPNRLAIMSALSAAEKGLPFRALRDACGLTDGNLNRHLKTLEDAKAVRIRKAFVDGKPLTTVAITSLGLRRFSDYLETLGRVLRAARAALPETARPQSVLSLGKRITP